MKNRRFTAVITAVIMLLSIFLTGFTYQAGIGTVYYETKSEIYDNATYHEQLAGHSTNGIERAYFVNVDMQSTDLKPYVFEGEVTGTYTLSTMISTLEEEGYRVVAGINGDLFDTSSGVSKGLTIHDGKIKTSGYAPEYVISFDEDGAASLQKVNLRYTLKGTINVPVVITPPEDPTESEEPTEPEEPEESEDPTDLEDPAEAEDPGESTETTESEDLSESTDTTGTADANELISTDEAQEPEQETVYIQREFNADIEFFNVPHGGAKAVHLFNRQYAPSTKTSGNCVEVILATGSPEDAELTVGGTVTATVVEVRNGNSNAPIGASQLVLSTAGDSAYAEQLSQLIPGSEIEISVYDGSGNLSNSREAIGIYYVLYHNGQFGSSGTNVNPRTAIGIKPDGTLLLYVLDGRQPGFSEGLGLTDTARHLVDLGCSTVVNMDGGGSSVIAVREGGLDSQPVTKNSPSGQKQRKTTNGLLLVYDQRGDTKAAHLHTYPSQPLAMPGAEIQLTTYASNEKYEPVRLRKSVEYWVDSSTGSTVDRNGLFTAGDTTGTAVIEVESGQLSTTAQVDIQNNITFTPNVQSLKIEPGDVFDINVTARYGYAPIASKDSLFSWDCDPVIGTIDVNGLFQGTNETGVSGNIYIEYNGVEKTIPVQVGDELIDFEDTKSHWAREFIGRLAAKGIVNGVGDDLFLPDDALTRAQFLTMLANTIQDLDVTQAEPAGFEDVPEQEWYYNYVNWGFEQGIVAGIDEVTFAPNEKITREQMAIMLDKFTDSIGLVLPETNAGVTFTDSALISSWAADSVNKIVSSGLMGGYPEGDYKPQGSATRAEAATVVYKLIMIEG